jgi:hypothetical protein
MFCFFLTTIHTDYPAWHARPLENCRGSIGYRNIVDAEIIELNVEFLSRRL